MWQVQKQKGFRWKDKGKEKENTDFAHARPSQTHTFGCVREPTC